MDWHLLSNSEIDTIIQDTFNSKAERNIVHDRIIDGLTFDEIISRYLQDCDDCTDNEKRRIIATKILPLLHRFNSNVS